MVAQLSELQTRKLTRLFQVLDTDKDGFLEWEDYQTVLGRLADLRGWKPGSSEYQGLEAAVLGNWNFIRQAADTDRDERVSNDEWLSAWSRLYAAVDGGGPLPAWFQGFVDGLFEAIDLNRNGLLTTREYAAFLKAHGIEGAAAEAIFRRLSFEEGASLDREGVTALAREFHFGHDPQARGNFLFGDF